MKSRILASAIALVMLSASALASQDNLFSPTSGAVSGLQLTNNYNNALKSLAGCNSGSTAPNNLAAGAVLGQCWIDTSVSPNPIRIFDGVSTWLPRGYIDATNHIFITPIGGGVATVASASTTDLCSVPQNYLNISGSATIAGFGSTCTPGDLKVFVLGGAITLTNSSSLANPSNLDIPGVSGDTGIAAYAGGGNWVIVSYTKKDGTPLVANIVTAQALQVSARAQGSPINLQINAGVASNILTVSLVGANGSTPSSTNPVLIPFRDVTVANGDPVWRSLTSSLSVSTIVGASLGSSSGNVPFRFWVVAFDNAGTLALGLVNCSTASQIYPAINNEGGLQSSVSMTSGATSPGVIYTQNGTTITTRAFKILGHIDYASGLGTAGTYASAPTSIVLFGPGVKKPGDLLQDILVNNSAVSTTTNNYSQSATPPTPGGGMLIASQAITPTAPMNQIRVTAQGTATSSAASDNTLFIYDTTNSATRSAMGGGGANAGSFVSLTASFQTILSGTTTFSAYMSSQTGTTTLNGRSGVQFFGTPNSFIRVQEFQASLPSPMNDNNSNTVRMVG